jgi:hypothetical protein
LTISAHLTNIMRLLFCLFIIIIHIEIYHGRTLKNCRFVKTFYETHSDIFELNKDQTSLIIRPLYALFNETFSSINQSLSIGIIYPFADTYLVPVPLVFQCSESEQIYAPNDCEFTIIDTRVREKKSIENFPGRERYTRD